MTEPIPAFEGRPVDAVVVKMSGAAPVEQALADTVLGIDDLVQMVVQCRVVKVGHDVDKDGKLVRTQVVRPVELGLLPFNSSDPDDIGVLRALPMPAVSTAVEADAEAGSASGVDDIEFSNGLDYEEVEFGE